MVEGNPLHCDPIDSNPGERRSAVISLLEPQLFTQIGIFHQGRVRVKEGLDIFPSRICPLSAVYLDAGLDLAPYAAEE